jgi:hypothetical protein
MCEIARQPDSVTGMSKSTRMAHREILLQGKTQSLSGHGGPAWMKRALVSVAPGLLRSARNDGDRTPEASPRPREERLRRSKPVFRRECTEEGDLNQYFRRLFLFRSTCDEAIQFFAAAAGLLRCARNDGAGDADRTLRKRSAVAASKKTKIVRRIKNGSTEPYSLLQHVGALSPW